MTQNFNVLVLGGAGYIGSHIAKALKQASFCPITYDNLSLGFKEAVRFGPFEEGDLHDTKRLKEVLLKYKPMAVFHFAALACVAESVKHPAKYYQNNLLGTLSLLEALRTTLHAPIPFIFSSTCAIYGHPVYTPIDELHTKLPINPYGKSKLMAEEIIKDYAQAYQFPYAFLRYFNAAGADLDGELGEDHSPETHLIPLIIDAALGKKPVIEIYGTDYETKDGTAIRDYIHVNDLARAHIKALEHLLAKKPNIELNLGSGQGYSVKELITAVTQLSERPIPQKLSQRREGDPPVLIADSSLAQTVLNWTPSFSDLKTIISTAWKWREKKMQNIDARNVKT